VTAPFPYASPAALRAALTDRLKKLAASSPFTVTELHRQFAYDRLLARVFSAPDADRWVLKGAAALLARLDVARHSKDVDLSWQSTVDLVEAEHAFRAAACRDVGDYFVFDVGPAAPLVGDKGLRLAVVAGLGGRPFAAFSVDLVAGQSMTAAPEAVAPLVAVEIPGLLRVDIHPAAPQDVAPVVALSYGLTDRETQVAMHCIQGRATKEIARALSMSPYTVQDHLKSIFDKTGVRSRGELVGQIFLDHYATRWEAPASTPPGLLVRTINTGTP
jgi:DNA-binding CsgD family transcriptional regulator